MAGYQILKDGIRQKEILRAEGICPCCGHYPSIYLEMKNTHTKRIQNKYECPKCKSEWVGNLYDMSYNMITVKKPKKRLWFRG